MLRGLRTRTLSTAAVDVRSYKGHALVHVGRDGATGDLALVIEHSDTGTGGWTNTGVAIPAGSAVAGAELTVEVNVDKFKRFIRLGSASVGDAVLVAQFDGH